MASDKKMVGSTRSVPEGIFSTYCINIVNQVLFYVFSAVRIAHVQGKLQESRAKRHVEEVSSPWVPHNILLVCLHQLHEPSFRGVNSLEEWLVEDGLLSFLVDIDFQHFLHQLKAPIQMSDNRYYLLFQLNKG